MGVERDFLVFFGVEGKNFNLNGKSTTFSMGSMSEPRCYLYNDYNIIYQYISYKSIYTLYKHISLHINTYCTNQNLSGTMGDFNSWYTSFVGPLKQRAVNVGAVGAFKAQKMAAKINAMSGKQLVYPRL